MNDPYPAVDPRFVLATLEALVERESVNPAFELEPGRGGSGEGNVAEEAARRLSALGLLTEIVTTPARRPSVIATWRGRGAGPSLMLNGHLDTVGPGAMAEPFHPRREGSRLFGRGSYDMKGGVAAILGAVEALVRSRTSLGGNLVVALVADEETESRGTSEVLARVRTQAAIVTEPTELDLAIAHKGFIWLEVLTQGVAAHGSNYREGVDANLAMAPVLSRTGELARALLAGPRHALLGPASMHAAMLRGGSGASIYAASCRLQIERRTLPGERHEAVIADLTHELQEAALASHPARPPQITALLDREPYEAVPESAIARALSAAGTHLLGNPPRRSGVAFWTDAALLAAAGIDTVLFGPAGGGAHADVEWVELDSVVRCAEVLAATAIRYCARAGS